MYFVMTANFWATGATVPEAWANLQRAGRSKHVVMRKKHPWFILLFPDGTKLGVDDVTGNWSSDKSPVQLVGHEHLEAGHANRLAKLCKPQTMGDLLGAPMDDRNRHDRM